MYKSPIDIVTTDIITEIVKKQERQVLKAVQNVGVNVDKNELIRALNYDRQQYEKGYADGVKEFAERLKQDSIIIDVSDGYGKEEYTTGVTTIHIDNLLKEMG